MVNFKGEEKRYWIDIGMVGFSGLFIRFCLCIFWVLTYMGIFTLRKFSVCCRQKICILFCMYIILQWEIHFKKSYHVVVPLMKITWKWIKGMKGKSRKRQYREKLREKRNKMEDLSHKVTSSLLKGEGMETEDKI